MTRRKLLRVVEIAEILGVSKQRADQLRREPDFPPPLDRWARGDL
jgi:predicted DNA-binding transcriptional regulator AlpA